MTNTTHNQNERKEDIDHAITAILNKMDRNPKYTYAKEDSIVSNRLIDTDLLLIIHISAIFNLKFSVWAEDAHGFTVSFRLVEDFL